MKENQRPAKRREESAAGSMELEDRISQLPQPILQNHILSFLPQEDAVRTCLLSKSWRHLGPTRPKIEFHEPFSPESKQKFISVVENTLQRYDDQKIPIQEFIWRASHQSILFLNKWISRVILNLSCRSGGLILNLSAQNFSMPSAVFQAEHLTELYLKYCKLDQINYCIVKLQMLKRLSLELVRVEEETFEKIMSSCPLIEHLVVLKCEGLSTIKVSKARNLKHFGFTFFRTGSVEIDGVPSLETIRIEGGFQNWYHLNNNYFFPRLKSLYLWNVYLTTELLNNLSSSNCPCLEELQLHRCGFSEFKLSNRSIKRLIISFPKRQIKAVIDAANILCFEFRTSFCLPSISFPTTSRKCKSRIEVVFCAPSETNADVLSTWSLELYEFLKSLRQSQISLSISHLPLTDQDTYDDGSCEPVVVEQLCLRENYSSSTLRVLLNRLFRICRPRYIGLSLYENSQNKHESQAAESIWNTLVNKGETTQCNFWQEDLEESSIQVSDKNANEWRPVQICEFSNKEEIRFKLKWRDLS